MTVMIKRNHSIILYALIVAVALTGCSSIQISEPDKEQIFQAVGYSAAYWPLSNNPDYIDVAADAVEIGIALADSESVDVVMLVDQIVGFALKFLDDEELSGDIELYRGIIRQFSGLIRIYIDTPDTKLEAIKYIRAFLVGADSAISDLQEEV